MRITPTSIIQDRIGKIGLPGSKSATLATIKARFKEEANLLRTTFLNPAVAKLTTYMDQVIRSKQVYFAGKTAVPDCAIEINGTSTTPTLSLYKDHLLTNDLTNFDKIEMSYQLSSSLRLHITRAIDNYDLMGLYDEKHLIHFHSKTPNNNVAVGQSPESFQPGEELISLDGNGISAATTSSFLSERAYVARATS